MKVFSLVKIILFVAVLLGTSASGDDNYIDYRNTDAELCDKDWNQDTKSDTNVGEWARLTLHFKTNGKYDQSKAYYRNNESEPYRTVNDKNLIWAWADDSKERIVLGEKGQYTYFDNVMVRDHFLSGRLDGETVMFTDYR